MFSKKMSGIKKKVTILNSTTSLKVLRAPSRATHHVNCANSNAALGKAPQVGESCALGGSVIIKVSRKVQEGWGQSQDPGSTAEHVIATL
jgi:hypothetical protein